MGCIWMREFKTIAVQGFAGSGKDTVSEYLQQRYGFHHASYADSLKSAISVIFGWSEELLSGKTEKSRVWREQIDEWWSQRLDIPNLTPRWVMQHIGTDAMRNHFHPDIWISSLERKLQYLQHDVVISDCRFANELQSVKNQNGILVRVNRGKKPKWYKMAQDELKYLKEFGYETGFESVMKACYPNVHVTEWGWIAEKFDYEIENDGTLDELYRKIDEIMVKIQ